MEQVDCVVAGAGVVGLAIARALALCGQETVLIERADTFGTETSSRNSEVIHAGLCYPANSLKSRLCLEGRELLYRYALRRGIAHRRCGKLIVATDSDQIATLADIRDAATAQGVTDLRMLSVAEARRLEPALACAAALLSPSTGIIDSHALMLSLLGEAETAGAALCVSTEVVAVRITAQGFVVRTRNLADGREFELLSRRFVNAAGLSASALARKIQQLPSDHVPVTRLARGNYYGIASRGVFSRLIYPVPEPGGLGVHLTLDLQGGMRFGPDVEWIDSIDYRTDVSRAARFASEIRKYWPALPEDQLRPDYCGIRPKLSGPGEAPADFRIDGPARHGVPGLLNLFGIESPGLTAALAIARLAVARLDLPVAGDADR